jgi:hypothetical protein
MNDAAPPSKVIAVPVAIFDFALRLAFFFFAPAIIVVVWMWMPITGALVNVALALVVFFAGETVRRLSTKVGIIGKALKKQLEFEEYYRSHKPRPFIYYVFYPVLFPYWLLNREARREFLLFKGYTIVSFVILLGMAAVTFYRKWYPELSLRHYVPTLLVTLLVESMAVLMLMMPLATTVVTYHIHRRRKRLTILLLAGLASIAGVAVFLVERRDPIVSYETRERLELRTVRLPKDAHRDQMKALEAAWDFVKKNPDVVQQDGKITGVPLQRVRKILDDGIYKPDESYAFDLWAFPPRRPDGIVLYYKAARRGRTKEIVWVAMDSQGKEIKGKQGLSASVIQQITDLYGQ